MLKHERDRNLEQYNREYRAEFVENVVSWINPEVLDPCIIPGRTELARVNNGIYVAAVDPASSNVILRSPLLTVLTKV